MKKLRKSLIVLILFAIIITLAITTRPTLASLPGQTVPTAKPNKTKTIAAGNQNSPSSTNTPIPILFPTSTSTGVSGLSIITSTQAPVKNVIPTITPQFILTQISSQTTTAQFTFTQTSSQTITETYPVVRSFSLTPTPTSTTIPASGSNRSNPASSNLIYYGFIIILMVIFIVGIVTGSRRKTVGKPPGPDQ